MGLDSVELVMETEDAFGIRIPDNEAEKVNTVGDLFQLVLKLTGRPPAKWPLASTGVEGCATAAAFYRVRRAMDDLSFVPREAIRPQLPLATAISKNRIVTMWPILSERLGVRLPVLQKPAWTEAVWMSLILLAVPFMLIAPWVGVALLGLVLVTILSIQYVPHTSLPHNVSTIGDLSRWVAGQTFTARPIAGRDHEDIWLRVQQVVCEQMGVTPDEVRPETRLIQDLGMD